MIDATIPQPRKSRTHHEEPLHARDANKANTPTMAASAANTAQLGRGEIETISWPEIV
jgi:hypothetical protein